MHYKRSDFIVETISLRERFGLAAKGQAVHSLETVGREACLKRTSERPGLSPAQGNRAFHERLSVRATWRKVHTR